MILTRKVKNKLEMKSGLCSGIVIRWLLAAVMVVMVVLVKADEKHFMGDQHNPKYDHEAFLGADEAKNFEELSPEESRLRLAKLIDKIDENTNGYVSLEELKDWINYTQKRFIVNDVNTHWRQTNGEQKEKLSWEEYRKAVYGFMDTMTEDELEAGQDGRSYKRLVSKERRRWSSADSDHDDFLTKDEFTAFLHPEEVESMKDLVALETIEELDTNNDGKIDVDEYIRDLYNTETSTDPEPDWVKNEKLQFEQYRDKDKDGFLTLDEVRQWILPSGFDHALAEAQHLIYEADTDKDNQLSKDEILDKYDLFVGSQATDFGQYLISKHEEL